ncbi:O-antigen ligase family protein [Thalassotalea euphylliae]|uniref:O-antigen ligase family protein n=1 Tax=Thalassotalea euphylliae TaxID=1655234 RepID=UPI0015F24D3A|nr:O-antigen ligase family protein [Thalassotalea euphylliae]
MPYRSAYPKASFALFQLTFLMFGLSLLVDAINGFFLSGLGVDTKLSAMFKILLIGMMLYQLGSISRKALAWSLITFLLFLAGPLFTFIETLSVAGFFDDFTSALRILTTMLAFIYICYCAEKYPEQIDKYGKYALVFAFLVLIGNIVLGVLGFGFSSYGNAKQGEEDAIGIKGFFYAGNEVSGVFVVLYGVILHLLWQKKGKLLYLFFSLITLLSGLLIATKAAMMAAALLVFAIPLLNERHRILNLTPLKLKLIAPIALVGGTLAIVLIPIFESTGLLDRFIWFYEKKGVIGIILSGRDEFIINMMRVFEHYAIISDVIFGISKTGLGKLTKNAMEIDPIDMFLWHGLIGLTFFMVISVLFLRISYLATRQVDSMWGPAALIINIVLIGISFIAGHIFTSGMLAPLFALINGLAYMDLIRARQRVA